MRFSVFQGCRHAKHILTAATAVDSDIWTDNGCLLLWVNEPYILNNQTSFDSEVFVDAVPVHVKKKQMKLGRADFIF